MELPSLTEAIAIAYDEDRLGDAYRKNLRPGDVCRDLREKAKKTQREQTQNRLRLVLEMNVFHVHETTIDSELQNKLDLLWEKVVPMSMSHGDISYDTLASNYQSLAELLK